MHLHFANFVSSNIWALQLQIIFVINSVQGKEKYSVLQKKKGKKRKLEDGIARNLKTAVIF